MRETPFVASRLHALSGLLYVLSFAAAMLLPGLISSPGEPLVTPYSSDADVQQFLNSGSPSAPVGAFFQALAAVALLVFTAYVAVTMRRRGDIGRAAGLAHASGAVASALLLSSAAVQWIMSRPGSGSDLRVFRFAMDLAFMTGGPLHIVTLGLFVGAASAAMLQTRALPSWLGRLGIGIATLCVLAIFSLLASAASVFIPAGRFIGFIWFAAASVLLARRGRLAPDPVDLASTR
ncbi:hypothetical protein [Micromonospora sp. 050-3]|uniref:hypothetical protein n=1 Tax=Micromonospora sp. 050-3 TaxID=2789265 RepID=UPI0039783EBE